MTTHDIDPCHRETGAPYMAPAYLANGLIGLRIGANPLLHGTALVNGFFGVSPEKNTEEYAPAPYPIGADLQLEGVWLSARPDLVTFQAQRYDFSCGELISDFTFHVGNVTATVQVITFCSRTQPTLALQEITVSVDHLGSLVMQAQVTPEGLEGQQRKRIMPTRGCDGMLLWESRGGLCTVGVAYQSEITGDGRGQSRRNDFGYEDDLLLTQYSLKAKPGERYLLRQIGSLVPNILHSEPHWQASRMIGAGAGHGFAQLREDNRAAWAGLWQGRPIIHSVERRWQDAADAAFFYLHSSISPATPCSMAPFGLSRRKEYSGHVFWDCETFMFPPVLLTAPHAARAILDYRSRQCQAARDNARMQGYRGLQFPWQSGLTGSEVTPFYTGAAGGTIEQHINMDVAFAYAQYVHATGDQLFMRQQAWPVLEGVAEWIVSRVTQTARGFEIRHITGPDEGIDNIHNNAYTNMTAIVVLREAIAFARQLGFTPPASWVAIAEGMFLPIDPAQVILKHDAYSYTDGMCVPETLGGFFPFSYTHSGEVDQATYRYHLDRAHSYLGMPMFSSLYGVWAARMGERTLSRQLFEEGVLAFLVEPFRQFSESSPAMKGTLFGDASSTVFLTNPAGFLLSLMFGLTGLQLHDGDPATWAKHPVVMPEGWEGITIERIWARGCPARLCAMHGMEHARIELLS